MKSPSSPKPRVVAVLGAYAPSLINFRGALIAALIERGYRVLAMAPDIDRDTAAAIGRLGAVPVSVPIENQSLSPVSMARTILALWSVFVRHRPDTVIAYTIKPVTLGSIAASAAGVPRFISLITGIGFALVEGTGTKRKLARAVAKFLYRNALRRSFAVIFQNPDDRDDFETLGLLPAGANVSLVNGSGVDLDHFRQAPVPPGSSFLMVARLLGDKGVREYAAAVRELSAKYPAARFRLAGWLDGSPDSIGVEELARMVEGGLEFVGRLEDVRPAIAEASIYVLPSYREGTPRSVLEAMAMGRAVITTDAPGCRETVQPGRNGLLVPPRNYMALASAMEGLIRDPRLAQSMGKESRIIAEERFDVHLVNRQMLAAGAL